MRYGDWTTKLQVCEYIIWFKIINSLSLLSDHLYVVVNLRIDSSSEFRNLNLTLQL